MKTIFLSLLRYFNFGLVLLLISIGHFFNANPHCQELEIGQPLEQIETIIEHRKAIKKKWQHFFEQTRVSQYKINPLLQW